MEVIYKEAASSLRIIYWGEVQETENTCARLSFAMPFHNDHLIALFGVIGEMSTSDERNPCFADVQINFSHP